MAEDALELRTYLNKGWAVASVKDFQNGYNGPDDVYGSPESYRREVREEQ